MNHNLSEIFEAQKKLDEEIFAKHEKSYASTFSERKLALFVEMAELANEVRSFKYWSTKPSSDKDVILEEYVDVIHFATSFGIHFNIDSVIEVKNRIKLAGNDVITKKLNKLFSIVSKFDEDAKSKKMAKLISKFYSKILELGYSLGFKFSEIKEAYQKKSEINHERQKNNY